METFCLKFQKSIKQKYPGDTISMNIQELADQYKLTNKEKVILEALLEGSDPKEIAYKLNNSYNTILTHQKNLYRKLEITNLRQLFFKFRPDNAQVPVTKNKRNFLKIIIPAAAVVVFAVVLFAVFYQPFPKDGYLATFDGWFAINDMSSICNFTISKEIIDGKTEDCITIYGTMVDDPNFLMTDLGYYGWNKPFSGVCGDPDNATNAILFNKMRSISFKVLGDGNEYFIRLATHETNEGDHWLYIFPTVKGETITVTLNVPDDLVRVGWSGKNVEFIQKKIILFQFEAVRPGPFHLKFWDIRLYNRKF